MQLCADPKASKDTKYVRQNNDDFDAKKKKKCFECECQKRLVHS